MEVRDMGKPGRRGDAVPSGGGGGGGGGDLISDLSDDLLVRILELLADARDVVRTHALSRRWRGLWTRVTALRFDFDTTNNPRRFVAFVDGALKFRAAEKEPAVEHLAFSFDMSDYDKEPARPNLIMQPFVQAAQRWIHYAVQHPVKSLVFKLHPPWYNIGHGYDEMALDDLPSSAKLETMHLKLSDVHFRLPSTAVFASLTDLSIEHLEVEAGGGHLLARLVSPACCPRLRRLRLDGVILPGLEGPLMIDAGKLLDLSLKTYDLRFLELRTPCLKILHVEGYNKLEGLTISAPRLEELDCVIYNPLHIFATYNPLHIDDKDDALPRVERLKIRLLSHGYPVDDRNDVALRLLECCRLTRYLEVSLQIPKRKKPYVNIIRSRIPQLPHVTSLTIHVTPRSRHSYAAGIASLLAQCKSITHLRVQLCWSFIKTKNLPELVLLSGNSRHWKSHKLSLAHLQEAEFKELMGTDLELQFIQFILTRASGIQKVAVTFDRDYWLKGNEDCFKAMPPIAGGSWTTCNNAYLSYKWTHCV